MGTGRPSKYTDDLADLICEGIAKGLSLEAICRQDDMPNPRSIYRWLRENESFCQNYTRAREDQADYFADEIVGIADTEDDSAKARVRIDARKWVASKLKPKKYGDKVTQELVGEGGGPIKTQAITFKSAK